MLKELCAEPEVKESPLEDTRKVQRICFVCTGNTCRSPMAEAVLNFLGNGRYTAYSAGLSAMDGDPINEKSVIALEKAGVVPDPLRDFHKHRAVMLDELLCEGCDQIVAMTPEHLELLRYRFPQYGDKFSVMIREIPDPFMWDQAVYDRCLSMITDCIKEMFSV